MTDDHQPPMRPCLAHGLTPLLSVWHEWPGKVNYSIQCAAPAAMDENGWDHCYAAHWSRDECLTRWDVKQGGTPPPSPPRRDEPIVVGQEMAGRTGLRYERVPGVRYRGGIEDVYIYRDADGVIREHNDPKP